MLIMVLALVAFQLVESYPIDEPLDPCCQVCKGRAGVRLKVKDKLANGCVLLFVYTGVDHISTTYNREHQAFSKGQPEWGTHLAEVSVVKVPPACPMKDLSGVVRHA